MGAVELGTGMKRSVGVRGFSFFDVLFVLGVLLSVRVMVAGVEREQRSGHTVVRVRLAMLAGMCTLSGFLGALLIRLSASRLWISVAVLLGMAVGALSAQLLVARAVAMPVTEHEFDPRYALQGVPALVIEPIPANGAGLVQLPAGAGRPAKIAARSLDGRAIARGEEVGVERIDDGVAFVEMWSSIETRL
jgi:hypothetical protein